MMTVCTFRIPYPCQFSDRELHFALRERNPEQFKKKISLMFAADRIEVYNLKPLHVAIKDNDYNEGHYSNLAQMFSSDSFFDLNLNLDTLEFSDPKRCMENIILKAIEKLKDSDLLICRSLRNNSLNYIGFESPKDFFNNDILI